MVRDGRSDDGGSMTTTPPEAPAGPGPQEGPRTSRDELRDLGRLRRSTTDRKVAGVAGGLGRHLDVDPLLLRVVLVVLVFFGGAGLMIYGACWLLVPEDDESEPVFSLDERTRTVALVIVGVVAAAALVGDSWGFIGFPWPVMVVGAVVLWALTRTKQPARPPVAPYAAPVPPGYAAPPPGYAVPPTATTQQGWVGPPTAPYNYNVPPAYVPPVRRDPRKQGPILFWFTLALVALGEGVLGALDLAGAPVADAAYPAIALGIVAGMLVLGAFYGRAGGLIALGLVAALGLAGATAASEIDGGTIDERPLVAADLDPSYRVGAGELVVDLTDVADLAALDGRTLELDVSVGSIRVLVPEDLAVRVDAAAHGPGSIDLFGQSRDGIDTTFEQTFDPRPGDDLPLLTIDAEVNLGEIKVRNP